MTAKEGSLRDCVVDQRAKPRVRTPLLGVLPGEGIGPEVIDAALEVVRAVVEAGGHEVTVEVGGPIGRDAEREVGSALPEEVVGFCERVFDDGGAILNGPGGGRYVYELRRRLKLFLKISPVKVRNGLAEASPLRPTLLEDVDVLIVRDNLGGVYQGEADTFGSDGDREIRHSFSYRRREVRRFLSAAARLAAARRGELTVVTKEAGVPEVDRLWRECASEAAEAHRVGCSFLDVDLMAYRLVSRPREFDVVAAPNLYADVLGDVAAVLVGSRALSYSGSFTPAGHAVYQTNHGAAYDIAGTDRANPVGQILSAAMLLRESVGLEREASAVEEGVRGVWSEGRRTADIGPPVAAVGTREMGSLVAKAAVERLSVAADAA